MSKHQEIAKLRGDLADARRKISECVEVMDAQGQRIVRLEAELGAAIELGVRVQKVIAEGGQA